MKANLQKFGAEDWGHPISDLLQDVWEKINLPPDLMSGAKQLAGYYIIGKYPNGWSSGIPADYIGKEAANDATGYSRKCVLLAQSAYIRTQLVLLSIFYYKCIMHLKREAGPRS